MPVDNDLYDRLSDTWWDDGVPEHPAERSQPRSRALPQAAVAREIPDPRGPPRTRRRLRRRPAGGAAGALRLPRDGRRSLRRSLDVARAHAHASGLDIDYVHGVAEALPADDDTFDAVVCCDVLEHVTDLSATIREAERVLRPGGIYLYDTINRTMRSKLLVIKIFQEWPSTACMPPHVHEHAMFIKPIELAARLRASGLEPGPIVGIGPGIAPPRAIALMRARARGRLTYGDLGRALQMRELRDTSAFYTGTAAKPAVTVGHTATRPIGAVAATAASAN